MNLSIRRRPLNRLSRPAKVDRLPKTIQGKKASEPEARLAKVLDRLGITYYFIYEIQTPYTALGQKNQIDFVCQLPLKIVTLEVDGEFAHKTVSQKESDRQRDALLNDIIRKDGWDEIIRIDARTLLKDDRVAERTARQILRV
jgi:uncharacterized ParB-like nuclease family protein